ncbi:MAG: DUF3135 domain-containing protein [Syntrophotaleaceae bacterium]
MDDERKSAGEIFERLAGLYQQDPEEFERVSKALIREALDKLPQEQRARGYGLQMRIEHRLRPFKDPVARMNEMIVIFWENFYKFQQILNHPGRAVNRKKAGSSAKIIPITRKNTLH